MKFNETECDSITTALYAAREHYKVATRIPDLTPDMKNLYNQMIGDANRLLRKLAGQ